MAKSRLDLLMVTRGLADSRSLAQKLVMAGQVRVDGQLVLKPATAVSPSAELTLEQSPRFVSRGGEKLKAALEAFEVHPTGMLCADVGASTGGFTDCLLQHGATRVYAIDVGHGILHWKLRQDERVVVMERTNARFLSHLPELVNLITIDASFISLKILLPVVKSWFYQAPDLSLNAKKEPGEGQLIALIKPQFEAGRALVSRGDGVIRDPAIHRQVIMEVLGFAQAQGYAVRGLARSPLLGPKGNAEFLAYLIYPGTPDDNLGSILEQAGPWNATPQPDHAP